MSPHATITPTGFLVSIAWNTMAELPSYLQLAATTSRSSASLAVVVSTETSKLLLSACQGHHRLILLQAQEECRPFSRQPLASSVSGTWVPYELFPLYIWAW